MEKAQKARRQQLADDYPAIVSKLSLLTVAGLNIKHALERIATDYGTTCGSHNRKPAYDEILRTCTQIRNGVYEIAAYQELATRCGLPCYTKLCSYLISSLKRGTSDFNRLLSEEATTALLEQKSAILQQGELASTKLMGPMMLIFVSILCLVMVPAFLSMSL